MSARAGFRTVALLTLVLFLPALHFGFLQWDDAPNFLNNPHFRSLHLAAWKWMFTTHFRGPYQPLSWLSAALDYQIWGLRASGFHLTNILLHVCSAGLFYIIALTLYGLRPSEARHKGRITGRIAAAFAALFFSIHPLRVESVVWITERRDVLSGFFFMISWLLYLRFRGTEVESEKRKWFCFSFFAYAGAILSKGTAVGLIWIFLAVDAYVGIPLKRSLSEKWSWIAMGVAGGIVNLIGFRTNELAVGHYGLFDRLRITFYNFAFYLEKTIWPHPLAAYYQLPKDLRTLGVWFSLQAFLGIAFGVAAFIYRRKMPSLWLAWISYALILLPVSGVFQNGQQLSADRYSYLACLPWAIVFGAFFLDRPRVYILLGAGWVIFLAGLSLKQVGYWQNDITLWEHSLAVDWNSCLAHYNLGIAEQANHQNDKAFFNYGIAVSQCPEDADSHLNLGALYEEKGAWADAGDQYQTILHFQPNNSEAQNNLALVEARQNKWDDSLALLRKVVKENPSYIEARFNLGVLEYFHGEHASAQEDLHAAISSEPQLAARLPPALKRLL